MNIFNINVPKDRISMLFDDFNEVENYNTSLYLYKSKIVFAEKNNKYSAKLQLDLDQKINKSKLVHETFNKPYGSYIIDFLNADFSTSENAYYSFFAYYGLEGLHSIDDIKKKFSVEYTSRYISTKNFLEYYNKVFDYSKDKYIKFQENMKKTVDFVFNLHNIENDKELDKYSKFVAFSDYADLTTQCTTRISFRIMSKHNPTAKTIAEVKQIAKDIADRKSEMGILYLYESTSHLALAYIALYDLIRNSTRNISVCQNCGRYYLQSSGKEVYCDLFNLDGSPSCKTYASRKAYDNKVIEDIAELTYKREYQRRITQVYRANKNEKEQIKNDYIIWKDKARKQLKLYRENKLSKEEFCDWIDKNK